MSKQFKAEIEINRFPCSVCCHAFCCIPSHLPSLSPQSHLKRKQKVHSVSVCNESIAHIFIIVRKMNNLAFSHIDKVNCYQHTQDYLLTQWFPVQLHFSSHLRNCVFYSVDEITTGHTAVPFVLPDATRSWVPTPPCRYPQLHRYPAGMCACVCLL